MMELLVPVGASLVVGLIAGAIIFGRLVSAGANDLLRQQKYLNHSDQRLYMGAMARNYAQILFPRWPDKFVEIEEAVYQYIKSMENMSDDQLGDILDEISQRNPTISEFDKIGLRDYVLYEQGFLSTEVDELIQGYKDCCIYSIFLGAEFKFESVRNRAKSYETSTLDKEERYIKKYAREYKDALFMRRCLSAMREFQAIKSEQDRICRKLDEAKLEYDYGEIFRAHEHPLLYQGENFEVYFVPHVVEFRTGLKLLDTGECAVQGVFYDDKAYVHWERTDDNFEPLPGYANQIWPMNLDFLVVPFNVYTEERNPHTY